MMMLNNFKFKMKVKKLLKMIKFNKMKKMIKIKYLIINQLRDSLSQGQKKLHQDK